MERKTWWLTGCLVLVLGSCAYANWAPLQFSFWSPAQVVPEEADVYGLRLNLFYGKNQDVGGIDIGMVNQVSGNAGGIQIAALWNCDAEFQHVVYPGGWQVAQLPAAGDHATRAAGLQVAGGVNLVRGDMNGIQIAPGNMVLADMGGLQIGIGNYANRGRGIQVAAIGNGFANPMLVNLYQEEFRGLQIAGLWNDGKDVNGIQIAGLYNHAVNMRGIQIGLINECRRMSGMQIGLFNVIRSSPLFMCPVVNASF